MNEELDIEKLDSPLVVHKASDASFEETASEIVMNETHIDDDGPTLERHRFKKVDKKGKKGLPILIIILVAAIVFAVLFYTGNITFGEKDTTKPTTTTTEPQTSATLQDEYQGTIVVKNTYLFVNGQEVDGIRGLQDAIKYDTPSTTAYKIIDENANSDFLNYEVLTILEKMGFYDAETIITHIESTGLVADAETTTKKTAKKPKKKPSKKSDKENQTSSTKAADNE